MPRVTRQKIAIRRVLDEHENPLAPEEVLRLARRLHPGLGIATVYRNLAALVSDKSIIPVRLPGAAPRYEAAGKRHHHHFHCRSCDSVIDLPGCPSRSSAMKEILPSGFTLDSHDITLFGRCADCAKSRRRHPRPAARRLRARR